MKTTKDQQARIDNLVNIWLIALQSTMNDAGWEGESILSRLIDFHGDLPDSTRNDQSNAAMVKAMRLMKGQHAHYRKIASAISVIRRKYPAYAIALLAKNFYRGLHQETGKPFTDDQRAIEVNQSKGMYRYNLDNAYIVIQEKLDELEEYENMDLAV